MTDVLGKLLAITLPDGSVWGVPVEIIARNRAKDYAGEFNGDVEFSMREDTVPLFQDEDSEIRDWASNNMNWSDVEAHAIKLKDANKLTNDDFEEAWANGEWEIVDRPNPNEQQKEHTAAETASILDLPMEHNDAGAKNIREYLNRLLSELITEEEGFSGKRPFGNSGWKYDLYKPLVKSGLVEGIFDEDGCLESFDREKADDLLVEVINNR